MSHFYHVYQKKKPHSNDLCQCLPFIRCIKKPHFNDLCQCLTLMMRINKPHYMTCQSVSFLWRISNLTQMAVLISSSMSVSHTMYQDSENQFIGRGLALDGMASIYRRTRQSVKFLHWFKVSSALKSNVSIFYRG